jgi:hypothetical protein
MVEKLHNNKKYSLKVITQQTIIHVSNLTTVKHLRSRSLNTINQELKCQLRPD